MSAATISSAQPARNASPPSGVIIPRLVTPVSASAYKLPENRTIPSANSQPPARSRRSSEAERDGGDQDRECVVHLVADPGFERGQHLGREPAAQAVRAKRAEPDPDEAGHCTDRRSVRSISDDCIGPTPDRPASRPISRAARRATAYTVVMRRVLFAIVTFGAMAWAAAAAQSPAAEHLARQIAQTGADVGRAVPEDQRAGAQARLGRAKAALDAGRLHLALYELEGVFVLANAFAFASESAAVKTTDSFIARWKAEGEPKPRASAEADAPAMIRALGCLGRPPRASHLSCRAPLRPGRRCRSRDVLPG